MPKRAAVFILFLLFFFIPRLNADTIYLKNGRSIEGIIKGEDTESVELEVAGGSVKFQKNEIEKISEAPQDADLLRKEWEERKAAYEERIKKQNLAEEQKPKEAKINKDAAGIMVKATLNGKVEVQFHLDTGASIVMLRRSVAEKLGMNLSRVVPDMQAQIANGSKVNAKRIILESVKVENSEAKNVDAAILLDEAGDIGSDGLLGMSFLKRFNFKVDQKEKKLILEKL